MQRQSELHDLLGETRQIALAATAIKAGKLVLWENGPVFALAGDAENPLLQQNISSVKKDRSPIQPLGWITPFSSAMGAIDMSVITDTRLERFLSDPDEVTRRIGALSFLRANADMSYKHKNSIPDALIPPQVADEEPSNVQLYSPTANDRCSRLVRYAVAHGATMAMTSANYHGQNEIVTYEDANEFAKNEGNLLFLPQYHPGEKPERPRGSYPVLKVLPDRLQLIRFGFLEPSLMADILDGLPIDITPGLDAQEPKHPHGVLRRQDLRLTTRSLKGQDLHDAVVESFMKVTTTIDLNQSRADASIISV